MRQDHIQVHGRGREATGQLTRGGQLAAPEIEPPPPRTKWTRLVPHPVLIAHAAPLTPY